MSEDLKWQQQFKRYAYENNDHDYNGRQVVQLREIN